jgi:hypothetical protein
MAGTRYEVRVGTRVNETTLAAFRVPVRPTVVPGSTVYRLRLPADRDLCEVLSLLTERQVQVLEIRRCAEPRSRDGERHQAPPDETADTGGVVIAFPRRGRAPGELTGGIVSSGGGPRHPGGGTLRPHIRGAAPAERRTRT